ncbi:MAG: putative ubiquitin-RnfH superfamily antitoxin RatB of RatAB toxin-antitoxin module [Phenylobacterium sp.]|jgi:putative ubiquitin-RnfH superfamily antitoxin RatB of RatAB toxin-antitoxin module
MSKQIKVEVVYGLPQQQSLLALNVDEGLTIEDVINVSGILALYPEIDLPSTKVGIWSKTKKLTELIRENDRIEIYRPLIADPKEVRKRRAVQAKEEGKADKVTGGRVDPQRKAG